MTLRTRLAEVIAGKPVEAAAKTPPEGELAGHGSGAVSSAYISAIEAQIGTYNPSKVPFSTMRKMETDPTIKACMALSELALRFAPWDVDGPDPVVSEFVRAALEPVWGTIMRSCGRTGVNEGCATHELVWQRTETHVITTDPDTVEAIEQMVTGWTIAKVKDIDPQSLRAIYVDGLENFSGYSLTYPTIDLPADKTFHFVTDLRFGNYWGEGRLVSAYPDWYQHRILTALFMRLMARRTTPAVHVEYPSGETDDGKPNSEIAAAMAAAFQSDATSMWTQRNEGIDAAQWSVKLIETTTAPQVANAFLAGLKAIEMRMMLAMLTPEKVLNGDGGSNALSDTHKDIWFMGVQGTLQEIIDAVNAQLVPRLVRYTFGNVAVPQVVSAGISDDNKAYLGALFTEMVKTGKVEVDGDSIAERIGVPTKAGESGQTEGEEDASLSEVVKQTRLDAVRLSEDLQAARVRLAAAL